jgi:hypothetical protein
MLVDGDVDRYQEQTPELYNDWIARSDSPQWGSSPVSLDTDGSVIALRIMRD